MPISRNQPLLSVVAVILGLAGAAARLPLCAQQSQVLHCCIMFARIRPEVQEEARRPCRAMHAGPDPMTETT